jgi:cell division protein FtsI/penicillin-binding protein 2
MTAVVSEGTGQRAKIPGIPIAGKTGTAQVVKKSEAKSGPSELKDHGWFASFAPSDNPQIAVIVLVENGGFGGMVAAPIGKAVYEAYFASRAPAAHSPATPEPEPDEGD